MVYFCFIIAKEMKHYFKKIILRKVFKKSTYQVGIKETNKDYTIP